MLSFKGKVGGCGDSFARQTDVTQLERDNAAAPDLCKDRSRLLKCLIWKWKTII